MNTATLNLATKIAAAIAIAALCVACGKKEGKSAAKVDEAKAKAGEAAKKAGEAAQAAGEAAKAAGEAAGAAAKEAAVAAEAAAKQAKAKAEGVAATVKEGAEAAAAVAKADASNALMDPSKATERAPDTYKVKFDTTKGAFEVEVTRAWAPIGADRFYNLVKAGFFKDIAIFRAIQGFMFQFGIHGDPKVMAAWRPAQIKDDPVDSAKASNKRGYLTFAMGGPNTRTTQMFINFSDNTNLDGMGFPPIGKVVGNGMTEVCDKINTEYGEGQPRGKGPLQGMLQQRGNEYLKKEFPNLDYIKTVTLVK